MILGTRAGYPLEATWPSTKSSFRAPQFASLQLLSPILCDTAKSLKPPEASGASAEVESDTPEGVLPRAARVIITGNARTSRNLVGKRGVIKKAVGAGGWHLLVRLVRCGCDVEQNKRLFIQTISAVHIRKAWPGTWSLVPGQEPVLICFKRTSEV